MKGIHTSWLCIFLTKITAIISIVEHDATATRVVVTDVVNPVKTGGLLSISCQIWNLNNDDQVTFFRQIKERTETISVNQDILSAVDDNVFLATRHMADGSVIYFLTIMYVTLQDAGDYSCKVSTVLKLLAIHSAHVEVQYFPDDSSPMCSPNTLPEVHEGSRLTLNCTSDIGKPVVNMQWERSGTLLSAVPVLNNDVLYSELRLTVSMRHHNNIFICSITHPAFPDKVQTCHLGPLRVIPKDGNFFPGSGHDDDIVNNNSPATIRSFTLPPATDAVQLNNEDMREQCMEVCSKSTSHSFHWKLATLIAVATAIVFMVCGCLLFVTMKSVDTAPEDTVMHPEGMAAREQLYTELSNKFDESKVYIALERQSRKELPISSRNDMITSDLREPRKY